MNSQNKPKNINELRKLIQKPKHEEELYAWYVMRRVSIYVSLFLAKFPITPNQITILSLLFGLCGATILILGGILRLKWLVFLGSLFFQTWYLLDCVDGELARLKKIFSEIATILDHIVHYLIDFFVIFSLSLYSYLISKQIKFLIFGMILIFILILKRNLHHLFSRASVKYISNKTSGNRLLSVLYKFEGFHMLSRMINSLFDIIGIIVVLTIISFFNIFIDRIDLVNWMFLFYGITLPIFVVFYFLIKFELILHE